jgi:hypothetical protein
MVTGNRVRASLIALSAVGGVHPDHERPTAGPARHGDPGDEIAWGAGRPGTSPFLVAGSPMPPAGMW